MNLSLTMSAVSDGKRSVVAHLVAALISPGSVWAAGEGRGEINRGVSIERALSGCRVSCRWNRLYDGKRRNVCVSGMGVLCRDIVC